MVRFSIAKKLTLLLLLFTLIPITILGAMYLLNLHFLEKYTAEQSGLKIEEKALETL